jgi:hypothetical protein
MSARNRNRRRARANTKGTQGLLYAKRITRALVAEMETLPPAEQQLWLRQIERYAAEMLAEIYAGRMLSISPFHFYGIDLGGGRSVWLQASQDGAGHIIIEAMTAGEHFESLSPANLIARIFAMDGAL